MEVLLNEKSAFLPPAALRILLKLVRGRLEPGNSWVELNDLAGTKGNALGWQGISRLNRELKTLLPEGLTVTDNDRNGGYRLHPDIDLGEINYQALAGHFEWSIRVTAKEVEEVLPGSTAPPGILIDDLNRPERPGLTQD